MSTSYIVIEKTKIGKIKVEVGKRAVRYKEKSRISNINKIIIECWIWKKIQEIKKRREKIILLYKEKKINMEDF